MSKRTRHYIVSVIAVLLAFAVTRLARAADWSDRELYVAAAGLVVLVGLVGVPWTELAHDGALRRRPHR